MSEHGHSGIMLSKIVLCAFLASAVQSPDPPTGELLVEQARRLLPLTDAADVHFLAADTQPAVIAAGHLLDAAILLSPDLAYAHWWRAYVAYSRGVDADNRGDRDAGRAELVHARELLQRAAELERGASFWTHRTLGLVELRLGDPAQAIVSFDAAVAAADRVISAAVADDVRQDAELVKFNARRARAEARMRALDFDAARDDQRAFYRDYGDSKWNRNMALAESHLRERDFVAARECYAELAADPEFARFDATHAALGYLAGIVGDPASAHRHLAEAMDLENVPTIYPLLWDWLLADDDRRVAARREFEKLVDDLPESVPVWDAQIGAFLLDRCEAHTLREHAEVERERRIEANESPAGLVCETWFYIGERRREHARVANDPVVRDRLMAEAIDAYVNALGESTEASKWEWEYARVRLAELARAQGVPVATESFVASFHDPTTALDPKRTEAFVWHRAGAPAPADLAIDEYDLTRVAVGDLVLWRTRTMTGQPVVGRSLALPATYDVTERDR